MELVNTVVRRDAPGNVVEFLGEGGEAVSVTIATGAEGKPDDELVATAKQMMMQLVAFDLDTVSTPQAGEQTSQVYTFEYQDKGMVRAMPGISLPSLRAVQDEVNRSAEDLWKDALDKAEAPVGWAVRARDASGEIVAVCTYEDIQRRDA
jgi:cytosine/adenosine deaminase-related metal-dependent hydrolase